MARSDAPSGGGGSGGVPAPYDRDSLETPISTPLRTEDALLRRGGEPMLNTAHRQRLETELKRRKTQVWLGYGGAPMHVVWSCNRVAVLCRRSGWSRP